MPRYVLTFGLCFFAFDAFAADALPVGGKHDNHAPIEVTSDTLEVFQQENKAVFTGHVVAIQQEVRLKADVMTVYYRKPEEQPADAKKTKAKSGTAAQEDSAIQKIDAEGNVFLSTPEETASGTHGIYDVEHHEIHLNTDVVLTKGKNVLKGNALVYNFDTGKSVLVGETTAEQGSTPENKGKQRVRALFVPNNDNAAKPAQPSQAEPQVQQPQAQPGTP